MAQRSLLNPSPARHGGSSTDLKFLIQLIIKLKRHRSDAVEALPFDAHFRAIKFTVPRDLHNLEVRLHADVVGAIPIGDVASSGKCSPPIGENGILRERRQKRGVITRIGGVDKVLDRFGYRDHDDAFANENSDERLRGVQQRWSDAKAGNRR